MIFPSRRLVLGLGLCAIPFILDLWMPGLSKLGWLATASLAAVALLDAGFAPKKSAFEVQLRLSAVLTLASEEPIGVEIRNRSGLGGKGLIRVDVPESWAVGEFLQPVEVVARGETEAVYRATPRKRGKYVVGPVYLRLPSPLGLLWRDYGFDARLTVKIYPAVAAIKRFDLLSRRLRTRELGLRAQRQRGQGMEFARLREHHPDDDIRSIDWKATARRGRFICREYQIERCQNVVLMVDAGRMLTEEVDGIVKIEYVLNAALLLTRIAAQYDDRVGALVFSDRVERMTPLRKGHAAVSALAEALYEVQPQLCEANYEAAFTALNAQCRKRALVVLFTNLVDQGTTELVSGYLKALRGRHVPLCVAVGDRETRDAAWAVPARAEDAYRKAAAAQLLVSRARTLQDLQRHGVHTVDASAGQIQVELINKYLDLKARQVL